MLALHFHQAWSFVLMLQDDSSVGWDPVHLWAQMGGLARGVVVLYVPDVGVVDRRHDRSFHGV